jgi:hypothetical protein
MNHAIMEALVDAIAFFANSTDDVVDPDSAVAQLESISATLRKSPADVKTFLAFVNQAAERARSKGDDERAEFLTSLPEHLGIAG